jgi:hypothetical protein
MIFYLFHIIYQIYLINTLMSKIILNILEEILFNVNYDDLDKIRNVHESIDQLIESSNLYWKNQCRIFMEKSFDGICFQRFNNNYKKIFNFCLGILNLQKKISKISQLKIDEIVNLQELNLFDNKLTPLPDEIGNLVNLQKLYLHYNQLRSLPAPRTADEIGNLVNRLYLHHNQLTFLEKIDFFIYLLNLLTSPINIMSIVNDYLLEEILFNINYDEQDGMKNVHESIDRIMESNLYWKNQYKIYMKKLFEGVCFQRFVNDYKKIFNFCIGILNLQKKICHI